MLFELLIGIGIILIIFELCCQELAIGLALILIAVTTGDFLFYSIWTFLKEKIFKGGEKI
jgi:hypothetical protein